MCYYAMQWGPHACWVSWYELPQVGDGYGHPHYFKCYDAVSPTPLNNRRIQMASQLNTNQVDPTLPQMNVTDWKACMSMQIIIPCVIYRFFFL